MNQFFTGRVNQRLDAYVALDVASRSVGYLMAGEIVVRVTVPKKIKHELFHQLHELLGYRAFTIEAGEEHIIIDCVGCTKVIGTVLADCEGSHQ
jgi:hypothetical protein